MLAFFFFFQGFTSPDFENSAFRQFCNACYAVRRKRPTLTLDGLNAVLAVAAEAENGAVTYERLAELCTVDYPTAAIYAAILSDGRGRQPGAKLLIRVQGEDRRAKCLVPSAEGLEIARDFASASELWDTPSKALKNAVLPALRLGSKAADGINLTAFCVLLYIAQHNMKFGHEGKRASIIADDLGITNLPRNLARLAKNEPHQLIELHKHPQDNRITLPELSQHGLTLVANIASVLLNKEPEPILKPKRDSLERATTPEDVKKFDLDDFDGFQISPLD